MSGSERLALVGFGAIGAEVARLLSDRRAAVEIVAVGVSDAARPRTVPASAVVIDSPDALAATRATLVVEAAGRASVAPWGMAALDMGADFAVSSTSAFVDEALLERMRTRAETTGARILIPPGALGGVDALAAAARMGLDAVRHVVVKPPAAWNGTEAADLCDLARLTAPVTFFEGSAREAADRFPKNANVAVISALAGIGLDRTQLSLVADPAARHNSHRIEASGDFGRLAVEIENHPLPGNPKSSAMTALNLVRLIENRVQGVAV